MTMRVGLILLMLALVAALFAAFRSYHNRQFDDPATFAAMPVSLEDTGDWKNYTSDTYGFTFRYPANYFLAPTSTVDALSLRQNTYSAEECRTAGQRIGMRLYRLGQITGLGSLSLTESTTVGDIQQHFLAEKRGARVTRTAYRRDINGHDTLLCVARAPGEMAWLTGGIYEVFIYGVYENKNGERILAILSNNAGGTPHTPDRALRRDMLRVFHTLRWAPSAAIGESPDETAAAGSPAR